MKKIILSLFTVLISVSLMMAQSVQERAEKKLKMYQEKLSLTATQSPQVKTLLVDMFTKGEKAKSTLTGTELETELGKLRLEFKGKFEALLTDQQKQTLKASKKK